MAPFLTLTNDAATLVTHDKWHILLATRDMAATDKTLGPIKEEEVSWAQLTVQRWLYMFHWSADLVDLRSRHKLYVEAVQPRDNAHDKQ